MMNTNTTTVLITGANKSIGFSTARILAKAGYHVFLGSRDKTNGEKAVAQLRSEGLDNVEPILIDISKEGSVKQAREALAQRTPKLDVLVNNAGIAGVLPQPPSTADVAVIRNVFETNLFGTIRVIQAFMDLLRKSELPRIVNVTSDLSSLTLHNDPSRRYYAFKSAAYGPSKTALNAYTVALAYELRDTPFKVNLVNPGYTATDFNQHRGTKNVEDAAALVAQYAMLDAGGPTGKFISDYGETPW